MARSALLGPSRMKRGLLGLCCALACVGGAGAQVKGRAKPIVVLVHGLGGGNRLDGWGESMVRAYGLDPALDAEEITFQNPWRDSPTRQSFTDYLWVSGTWAKHVQKRIREIHAKHKGRPIILIAHSWGSVMTKIALDGGQAYSEIELGKEPDRVTIPPLDKNIRIAELVTVGSPIGYGTLVPSWISDIVIKTGKPANLDGQWRNYSYKDDPVALPSWGLDGAENTLLVRHKPWLDGFTAVIPALRQVYWLTGGIDEHMDTWFHPLVVEHVKNVFGKHSGKPLPPDRLKVKHTGPLDFMNLVPPYLRVLQPLVYEELEKELQSDPAFERAFGKEIQKRITVRGYLEALQACHNGNFGGGMKLGSLDARTTNALLRYWFGGPTAGLLVETRKVGTLGYALQPAQAWVNAKDKRNTKRQQAARRTFYDYFLRKEAPAWARPDSKVGRMSEVAFWNHIVSHEFFKKHGLFEDVSGAERNVDVGLFRLACKEVAFGVRQRINRERRLLGKVRYITAREHDKLRRQVTAILNRLIGISKMLQIAGATKVQDPIANKTLVKRYLTDDAWRARVDKAYRINMQRLAATKAATAITWTGQFATLEPLPLDQILALAAANKQATASPQTSKIQSGAVLGGSKALLAGPILGKNWGGAWATLRKEHQAAHDDLLAGRANFGQFSLMLAEWARRYQRFAIRERDQLQQRQDEPGMKAFKEQQAAFIREIQRTDQWFLDRIAAKVVQTQAVLKDIQRIKPDELIDELAERNGVWEKRIVEMFAADQRAGQVHNWCGFARRGGRLVMTGRVRNEKEYIDRRGPLSVMVYLNRTGPACWQLRGKLASMTSEMGHVGNRIVLRVDEIQEELQEAVGRYAIEYNKIRELSAYLKTRFPRGAPVKVRLTDPQALRAQLARTSARLSAEARRIEDLWSHVAEATETVRAVEAIASARAREIASYAILFKTLGEDEDALKAQYSPVEKSLRAIPPLTFNGHAADISLKLARLAPKPIKLSPPDWNAPGILHQYCLGLPGQWIIFRTFPPNRLGRDVHNTREQCGKAVTTPDSHKPFHAQCLKLVPIITRKVNALSPFVRRVYGLRHRRASLERGLVSDVSKPCVAAALGGGTKLWATHWIGKHPPDFFPPWWHTNTNIVNSHAGMIQTLQSVKAELIPLADRLAKDFPAQAQRSRGAIRGNVAKADALMDEAEKTSLAKAARLAKATEAKQILTATLALLQRIHLYAPFTMPDHKALTALWQKAEHRWQIVQYKVQYGDGGGPKVYKEGSLTGVVRDAKTGKGLLGALVSVRNRGYVHTDASGRYTIHKVREGAAEVTVSHKGYTTKKHSFKIHAAATNFGNAALTPVAVEPNPLTLAVNGRAWEAWPKRTQNPIPGPAVTVTGGNLGGKVRHVKVTLSPAWPQPGGPRPIVWQSNVKGPWRAALRVGVNTVYNVGAQWYGADLARPLGSKPAADKHQLWVVWAVDDEDDDDDDDDDEGHAGKEGHTGGGKTVRSEDAYYFDKPNVRIIDGTSAADSYPPVWSADSKHLLTMEGAGLTRRVVTGGRGAAIITADPAPIRGRKLRVPRACERPLGFGGDVLYRNVLGAGYVYMTVPIAGGRPKWLCRGPSGNLRGGDAMLLIGARPGPEPQLLFFKKQREMRARNQPARAGLYVVKGAAPDIDKGQWLATLPAATQTVTAVSADWTVIACSVGSARGISWDLYRVGGGKAAPIGTIPTTARIPYLGISPRGKYIVAVKRARGLELVVMPVTDLKKQTVLTSGAIAYGSPGWSPDGRFIAMRVFREEDEAAEAGSRLLIVQVAGKLVQGGASSGGGKSGGGKSGGGKPTKKDLTKKQAYQTYIKAYNRLTKLMAAGKGDTPEAQKAYAEYKKAKDAYEKTAQQK